MQDSNVLMIAIVEDIKLIGKLIKQVKRRIDQIGYSNDCDTALTEITISRSLAKKPLDRKINSANDSIELFKKQKKSAELEKLRHKLRDKQDDIMSVGKK